MGDLAWQYTTSLHWSITQFTPASMDIYATNLAERIFSIFVLFWALVALSSIIANITASMTAIRNMGNDEMKQMWMLRRYLREKHISLPLCDRIVKYLEFEQMKNRSLIQKDQVTLLKKISPVLKMELSAESGAPVLSCHPLFGYLSIHLGLRTMSFRICDRALTFQSYAEGDAALEVEDEAMAMYFIYSGQFDYMIDGELHSPLQVNNYLSEAALWTAWQHRGTLKACRPAELCCVGPTPFASVLRLHPRTFTLGKNYGTEFVAFMNNEKAGLTDIVLDCDVFTSVAAFDSYNVFTRSSTLGLVPTEGTGTEENEDNDDQDQY